MAMAEPKSEVKVAKKGSEGSEIVQCARCVATVDYNDGGLSDGWALLIARKRNGNSENLLYFCPQHIQQTYEGITRALLFGFTDIEERAKNIGTILMGYIDWVISICSSNNLTESQRERILDELIQGGPANQIYRGEFEQYLSAHPGGMNLDRALIQLANWEKDEPIDSSTMVPDWVATLMMVCGMTLFRRAGRDSLLYRPKVKDNGDTKEG